MNNNKKNPEKLELAYKEHYPCLIAIAYHILKNMEDAKDVVGHSFEKLCNYRDVESMTMEAIGVLLKEIARNCAYDYWRKADSKKKYLDSPEAKVLQSYEEDWASENLLAESHEVQKGKMEELIKDLVPELPDRQNKVFTLRFYERKSAHQVGELLNISVHTVNNTYSDAKKNLKKMLEDRMGKK